MMNEPEEIYVSPSIEILGAEMLCVILNASDTTGEGIGDELTFDGSDNWAD